VVCWFAELGNSIFKGVTVKEVKEGICTFDKLQIKEVSSHFRNGWVFLVVQPRAVTDNTPSSTLAIQELILSIQPFVLDNVIIKAKLTTKKKDEQEEERD
jgi:hypothetical protein